MRAQRQLELIIAALNNKPHKTYQKGTLRRIYAAQSPLVLPY